MVKKPLASLIIAFTVCTSVFVGCTKEKATPSLACNSTTTVSYSTTIKPIIDRLCIGCHKPGGPGNGDYKTNPYEGILLKVNSGILYSKVLIRRQMPPPGNPQLTDEEVNKIYCWMQQGALNN